jgi:hypothetical protein
MTFLNVVVSTSGSTGSRGGFAWATAAGRWADAVGPIAREAVSKAAPEGKGVFAGGLAASIKSSRTGGAAMVGTQITSSASYAGFVVGGTKAHVIVPRNKSVLRFNLASGGTVFTKRVNHPGTKANPFPQRGLTPLLPGFRTSFTEIMSEAMGGTP